jgi:hypothetical protein
MERTPGGLERYDSGIRQNANHSNHTAPASAGPDATTMSQVRSLGFKENVDFIISGSSIA